MSVGAAEAPVAADLLLRYHRGMPTRSTDSALPAGGVSAGRSGILAAFAAYGIWGIFPIYWKALSAVPPLQILGHRILWAAVFSILLLAGRKGGLAGLRAVLADGRRLGRILVVAVLIALNWVIYIWAVNSGRIADSSLGYYINPLLSIALGAIFLGERIDRGGAWAVGVATAGVLVASLALGSVPWVSLSLAATFAAYGLIKKRAGLDPLTGLAAETLVLAPLALAWLVSEQVAGRGSFAVPANGGDAFTTLLLFLAGPVTAVPLLAFAFAANRVSLQRLGFVQYLSPSLQLAIGVFLYGERPDPGRLFAFAAVVLAVLIYVASRPRQSAPGGAGQAR